MFPIEMFSSFQHLEFGIAIIFVHMTMKNLTMTTFACVSLLRSCHGLYHGCWQNPVPRISSKGGSITFPAWYAHRNAHETCPLDTGMQLFMTSGYNEGTNVTQTAYQIVKRRRGFPVQRVFISAAIALLTIFSSSLSQQETSTKHDRKLHVSTRPCPVYAGESPSTGMLCVAEYCSIPLSHCLSDVTCAKGLGCFMNCAVNDALASDKNIGMKDMTTMRSEGTCQVRCMDLYQNKHLAEFTECSLTRHHCYDALKPDAR